MQLHVVTEFGESYAARVALVKREGSWPSKSVRAGQLPSAVLLKPNWFPVAPQSYISQAAHSSPGRETWPTVAVHAGCEGIRSGAALKKYVAMPG